MTSILSEPIPITSTNLRPFTNKDITNDVAYKHGLPRPLKHYRLGIINAVTIDPSAPDAFVRGIMENKEWVVVNGVWTEQHCDMSKKYIKKASKKQLEEAKIQVFERFLRHLSSK